MDEKQENHVKTMASKIEQQAQAMVRRMVNLQNTDLTDIPVSTTQKHFDDLELFWKQIQLIVQRG